MDYHLLKRKQLQELCKKHGIPANLKSVDLANRLSSLLNEEKPEKVGGDENVDVDGDEENEEETLEKAVRRGKSCLKSMTNVVESKEVKRVKFSPENQMFLFEKTDPRAMRLLGRKKRAFVELREEENPVVVSGNSVESQSSDVVSDDIGRVGRRNVRRKSVVVLDGVGLVGENDDKVNGRNLRSRRGKAKEESAEVVPLVSPSRDVDVENVLKGQNLRRSSRRSMVLQAENLRLVTEDAEQVEKLPVKRESKDRNLRSREEEAKQESIDDVSLVSPCGENKGENVKGKRNSRRPTVVQALGFVTQIVDKVEKLPVKRGVVEQNLRSQKGKAKQESPEAVLLMAPCAINEVGDALKGLNLRRNLRSSTFVLAEDSRLVTENADEVETLPSKQGVIERTLRSRAGKGRQDKTEVVKLASPCAVSKVEDVVKVPNLRKSLRKSMFVGAEDLGLVTENADDVEKVPTKREIMNRNLKSRVGKANKETVPVVSPLRPSGNEKVNKNREKPVEEGILKRSLRSRGSKSDENDAEVVPSLSVNEAKKLRKGRKGKWTVEEGGDGEMVDGRNDAIDCKNRTKRGRTRKSVMAIEEVKAIRDASISKEEHCEDSTDDGVETRSQHSVETMLESKSKNRSRRKTLILKRQDFSEDNTEKPDAVKADHLSGVSTADDIVSESTQLEEDESCQAAISSSPGEQKTECFSVALPFSASGSQQLHVTYNTMALVDIGEEKTSLKEVVKSAEPIVQILANDNISTPLSQSASDVGANVVQKIPSDLLALIDHTFQEENTTCSVSNNSPLRSVEAQFDNLTSELLEQENSCKDSESSFEPLLSEDAIFNTVECRVLESKRDDYNEDLQEEAINQSGQLTVDTSLNEQVADDNEHQSVDSFAACNLSVSRKPEVAEPDHVTGDTIQKERSLEHVIEVTEFTPNSSPQPDLEHKARQSGECYKEKSTNEKTSEKAQLNSLIPATDERPSEKGQLYSLTPAKHNTPTPVMQKLYEKLTDENTEQSSNCRTFESSLKQLFLEDYILDTDKSKVLKCDEDDCDDKLQDTKTMTYFDANDEQVAVKLVNECSESKQCTMKIGSTKCTNEFASGGSTTECSPSDRKETNVADLDHATGNFMESVFKEDVFEEGTQLSSIASLQLHLAHDMPQSETHSEATAHDMPQSETHSEATAHDMPQSETHSEATGTLENSSCRPEVSSLTSAKIGSYGEEDLLPAVGDMNASEDNAFTPPTVVNKTSFTSVIDPNCLDASHTLRENCQSLNVVKDELFRSFSNSDGRIMEVETSVSNVGSVKVLDRENDMGDTMLDPSALFDNPLIVQLTEQEKMKRSMTGCGSISNKSSCGKQLNGNTYLENEHQTVDSTAACDLSVSQALEVAETFNATGDSIQMTQSVRYVEEATQFPPSVSLQLKLSHESMQLEECSEEKGNTIKITNMAQLNYLTPAISSNITPLRSMDVQHDMSTDEHMEHTINHITFESSLKHLSAEDFKLNTDESKSTSSEKDDYAEYLDDTMSVGHLPETKLDASLGEHVTDDNECRSIDNIDSNSKSMAVQLVNEGLEIGCDNYFKESKSGGLTPDREETIVADAVISSVSQAMRENCEALDADKDRQFGSLSELEVQVMENELFESIENLVKAPDSENDVGVTMLDVSALIDDKVTIQPTEQQEIARSISESPTTAKVSEDMETVIPLQDRVCRSIVPVSDSSFSAKTSFMVPPKVVEASGAVDCSSTSHSIGENCEASDAGKEQIFSSTSEPGIRIIENDTLNGTEGRVKAPDSVNEMDDTVLEAESPFDHKFGAHLTEHEEVARATKERDMVSIESSGIKPANEDSVEGRVLSPRAVEADCISKKPVPESDLTAETSFFLQPKVVGELAPLLGSMEKEDETSKDTSGDLTCSKNSICMDNLALVDRQPALKLTEEAHKSIEFNTHVLAEDHSINTDRETTPEPEKTLTAEEHNVADLGDKVLSVSLQDGKVSEPEIHFSANDCGDGPNCLFPELEAMSQAAETGPCILDEGTDDVFGVLFDTYPPQACDNWKHDQDDVGQYQAEFSCGESLLGDCVAFAADNAVLGIGDSHSSGTIETNTGEFEETLGGQDVNEAYLMHHEIGALEDGSGNKLCTEANSEIADRTIIRQNSNENQADDQTHTGLDDACTITNLQVVSQRTDDIEILLRDTGEASDNVANIRHEMSLNSETLQQYNTDQDSIRAQNVTAVDATDDDNSKLIHRSLLIHATPRKPMLPQHDMKENMLAPKRSQVVNATATKPMLKRKALRDI